MRIHDKNIGELVFTDKELQKQLPEFKYLFDQWLVGLRVPKLKFLKQKSELVLLEKLETKLDLLERHFGEKVVVISIDYHIARHHKVPLEDLEIMLNELDGFTDFTSISRNAEYAYLSFWR